MESAEDLAGAEQGKDDDAAGRLTYEIFSLVEAKVLFGSRDAAVLHPGLAAGPPRAAAATDKVCVLSIDVRHHGPAVRYIFQSIPPSASSRPACLGCIGFTAHRHMA
ncbi:unnamed protein product [Urochloa humidicola]